MAKTLSYQHANNAIRLLYEREELSPFISPVGENIYKEFPRDVSESKYAALYAFIDEQIALLRKASYFFGAAIYSADCNGLIYYRLCIKHMQTLASIRMLSSFGLDLDARALLRLLYENALLWVRFRVDPLAIEDFKRSSEPAESNSFWHRYLAKEKSEKFIASYIANNGLHWLGGDSEHREQLKTVAALSVHPSHIALSEVPNDWVGSKAATVLCETSDAAHFTLTRAIFVTAFPFCLKPELSYGLPSRDLSSDLGLTGLPVSWESYNVALRDMVAKLFFMSIPFANGLVGEEVGGEPGRLG